VGFGADLPSPIDEHVPMDLTSPVALASAAVSLIAVAATLYLGRRSQRLQINLKHLELELKHREEKRIRASQLEQT